MKNLTQEEALVLMKARHSVRTFTDEPLSAEERAALQDEIDAGNAEGGLSMRLVCDEPEAFDSTMAHYGKFSGVRNYVVLAGTPAPDLEERCGYYGERIVLLAQKLGLGTCWVALTFKRRYVKKLLGAGEKMVVVIALGHGVGQGADHKVKPADAVSTCSGEVPAWFKSGVSAALLAPTAMNQQSFMFTLESGEGVAAKPKVQAVSKGGAYSKVDLGIVKLHFELGAGTDNFGWA